MNIATVGVGGVGGYFGGLLTQVMKADDSVKMYFLARNEHLMRIKEQGLILETESATYRCIPTLATDDPDELPILDIILLCVKGYDLEGSLLGLRKKITKQTIILPLLNGIDIYDRVKKIVPQAVVLPACVFIGTHIEKPGTVRQDGGACTIIFGTDPDRETDVVTLKDLFGRARIKYSFTENPDVEIWRKFIFIAPFGLVCSYADKTIGEVLADVEAKATVEQIMKEIYSLSKAMNVRLPESIIAESLEKGKGFSHETKTSFHRDYGNVLKKDERDVFGKAIIESGSKKHIETPITATIYAALTARKAMPFP